MIKILPDQFSLVQVLSSGYACYLLSLCEGDHNTVTFPSDTRVTASNNISNVISQQQCNDTDYFTGFYRLSSLHISQFFFLYLVYDVCVLEFVSYIYILYVKVVFALLKVLFSASPSIYQQSPAYQWKM